MMTSAAILGTSAAMVDFLNQVSCVPGAFQKISSSTCSIFSSPTASGFLPFCGLSKQLQSSVSPSFSSVEFTNLLLFKAGCIYSQGTYSYYGYPFLDGYYSIKKTLIMTFLFSTPADFSHIHNLVDNNYPGRVHMGSTS